MLFACAARTRHELRVFELQSLSRPLKRPALAVRRLHNSSAKRSDQSRKLQDRLTPEQYADLKASTERTTNRVTRWITTGLILAAVGGCYFGYSYAQASVSSDVPNVGVSSEQRGHDAGQAETEAGGVYQALSLEEATRKMRREEFAGSVGGLSFHRNRLPSNSPVEDDFVEGVIDVPGSESGGQDHYSIWGVFDGHAGSATSATLREQLLPWLKRPLTILSESTSEPHTSQEFAASMIAAIKTAFTALDDSLLCASLASLDPEAKTIPNALARALEVQGPFYAGSCALVCLYDPAASVLYTACVGDSRAVLVRPNQQTRDSGTCTAIPLSTDQTGFNASEAARVRAEHPGEEDVIDDESGRTLGMAITRAFGDGLWKWSLDTIREMNAQYFGRPPRPGYKSPPYLTAEPEVTVTKVMKGDVLVMASDGLWDHMSSEAVGECVGRWLEKYEHGEGQKKLAVGKPEATLRAEKAEGDDVGMENRAYEKRDELVWTVRTRYIVAEDENAATSLIRNALGGNRRDLFTGVVSTKPPISRYARDDVTVQVVFF